MRRRDVVTGALALGGCASLGGAPLHARRPLVIGHRGCAGERPEHTMASYRRAIAQGADYIEPDLVVTKDGVLVCRHENNIADTTDVAAHPEFATRRATKVVDGERITGWFVEDFTLAELKTLRAKERLPQLRPANAAFDGQEGIPSFAEAYALAHQHGVGIYPELKHPTFLAQAGLDPVPIFVAAVRALGGQAAADRMFVQCFEVGALVQLAVMSSIRWTSIQLMEAHGGPWDRRDVSYASMNSDDGLRAIREYAAGIGVEKAMVVPRDANQRSLPPTDLVARAHRVGLVVHAWTFRAENYFLPLELRRGDASAADYPRQHGDIAAELRAFYALGVDGVFCDFPDLAVAARNR